MIAPVATLNPAGALKSSPERKPWETGANPSPSRSPFLPRPAAGEGMGFGRLVFLPRIPRARALGYIHPPGPGLTSFAEKWASPSPNECSTSISNSPPRRHGT